MKQKVVIKVTMKGQKSRSKAMKLVGGVAGVGSVAFAGQDNNHIVVTGDGIDAVNLTKLLRKKVGSSELVSVSPLEYTGYGYSYDTVEYSNYGYDRAKIPVVGYYSYQNPHVYGSGHGPRGYHEYEYAPGHGYETRNQNLYADGPGKGHGYEYAYAPGHGYETRNQYLHADGPGYGYETRNQYLYADGPGYGYETRNPYPESSCSIM